MDVEAKTVKILQRLQAVGEQIALSQNAEEDLAAGEILAREIEVLIKEKQTLENEIKQFQSERDYAEIKTKDTDSKVKFYLI